MIKQKNFKVAALAAGVALAIFSLASCKASKAKTQAAARQDMPTLESGYAYASYIDQTFPQRSVTGKDAGAIQKFIVSQLTTMGLTPKMQSYSFKSADGKTVKDKNIIVTFPQGDKRATIAVGATYRSALVASPLSTGATQSGAGTAALLDLARMLTAKNVPETGVKPLLIFFGQQGKDFSASKAYTGSLTAEKTQYLKLFISLKNPAGGDNFYFFSPSPDGAVYHQGVTVDGARMIYEATAKSNHFDAKLLPAYGNVKAGELGSTSAMTPFAALGIGSVEITTTNGKLAGKSGLKDGISQTSNMEFWYPADSYQGKGVMIEGGIDSQATKAETQAPTYPRDTEAGWGMIAGTKYDNMKDIDARMPGRMESQLKSLSQFLSFGIIGHGLGKAYTAGASKITK